MNIEITGDDLRAMQKVVEYLHYDECKDYQNDPRPGHVFLAVETLRNFIDRTGF